VRRSLVSCVLGLAVLCSCTASPEKSAAPVTAADTQPALTLTCAGAIDEGPPPSGFETVLGVVALPTGEALGAYDSGDPGRPGLFAKTGLLVRAGRSSDLVLAPRPDDRVAIGWGNVSFQPAMRFVVPACPDTFGTGWLVYPGGFWADEPLCLTLTVRSAGQERDVHVGVGVPCPGQAPLPAG
jgi:hypothetical protein